MHTPAALLADDAHQPLAHAMPAMGAAGPIHDQNPEHFVTAGEKKFDFLAYTGIGYIVNVALSLAAVYAVERTGLGQKMMGGLYKAAEKVPGGFAKAAKYLAGKTFFLTGGFAVLVPIKMMEDNKLAMVKKWNRETYGAQAEIDPQIIQSEKEVAEAPKQGWLSIMGSRVLSLIPFYLTVGLLWENKSPLGKVTNKAHRNMDAVAKKEFHALQDGALAQQSEFSKTMSHGVYADRPIAAASRWIGKGLAKLTGNTGAVAQITEMQQQFPGMIKEGADKLTRDPNHSALPYYFICEAITSAIVARAVYLMTRVLGPLVGIKPKATVEAKASHAASPVHRVETALEAAPAKEDHPVTKVQGAVAQGMAKPLELAAAR